MELFTRQAAVALFFGLFATSTQAKEFSYLETFDDDATFSAGGALPDGWLGDASAVPVQRYEGAYLGSGNHSGSYVLGTMASTSMGRDSWVYTRKLTEGRRSIHRELLAAHAGRRGSCCLQQ